MEKKTSTVKKAATSKAAAPDTDSKLLGKFLLDGLKDIYWAEKALVKALSKMEKKATTDQLKGAFNKHRAQTEAQITRLEQVFTTIGAKAAAKKCEAMNGLLKEADDIISETEDKTVTRDAALIMAAQKVEHYEIATYGGLAQLARTLGQDEAAGLLAQTLQEEKETDELLTQIAESTINIEAAEEPA